MREQLIPFIGLEMLTKENVNNGKMKVLDFRKIAEIIVNEKPIKIEGGLLTDWEYTSVILFEDGQINTDIGSGYLGSKWATPAIIIEYSNGEEKEIECFTLEEDYDSDSDMWESEILEYFKSNNIKIGEE